MEKYNLYRLCALLYPTNIGCLNKDTIIKKVVESYFVITENQPIPIETLPESIDLKFNLLFEEGEIKSATSGEKDFSYAYCDRQLDTDGHPDMLINLCNARFEYLRELQNSKNIYRYIERYYQEKEQDLRDYGFEEFNTLIESFLYKIFIQNLLTSKALFGKELDISHIVENLNFSEIERKIINGFLDYENDEKDKAIFDIGSLAIEYVTLNGHVDLQSQINNITSKTLYLDTNILFRLLGINGERRRVTTYAFLKKCSESGQKVIVSYTTEKELHDAINRGIERILHISPNIKYLDPLDDDSIIKHYLETKKASKVMDPSLYRAQILQRYKTLKQELSIIADELDYYATAKGAERIEIDTCTKSLQEYKEKYLSKFFHIKEELVRPDAINLCYIKKLRKGHERDFNDTMHFFVTADKKLSDWNEVYFKGYPITVCPSDWLSILLKYVSRSSDDYRSFVNFIKNITHKETIDPDTALCILDGIAEVADKLENQQIIYDDMVAHHFDEIVKGKSFAAVKKNAQDFATKHLEDRVFAIEIDKTKQEEEIVKQSAEINALRELENARTERDRIRDEEDRLKNEHLVKYVKIIWRLEVAGLVIGATLSILMLIIAVSRNQAVLDFLTANFVIGKEWIQTFRSAFSNNLLIDFIEVICTSIFGAATLSVGALAAFWYFVQRLSQNIWGDKTLKKRLEEAKAM